MKKRITEDISKMDGSFGIMVMGTPRIGKSTLMNAIFGTEFKTGDGGDHITTKTNIYKRDMISILDTRGASYRELAREFKHQLLSQKINISMVIICIDLTQGAFNESIEPITEIMKYKIPILVCFTRFDLYRKFKYIQFVSDKIEQERFKEELEKQMIKDTLSILEVLNLSFAYGRLVTNPRTNNSMITCTQHDDFEKVTRRIISMAINPENPKFKEICFNMIKLGKPSIGRAPRLLIRDPLTLKPIINIKLTRFIGENIDIDDLDVLDLISTSIDIEIKKLNERTEGKI